MQKSHSVGLGRTHRLLVAAIVIGALSSYSLAQDVCIPFPTGPQAIRSSPFDPPEASDNTFVVDAGPFLDTGCSFRSAGPLIIRFEVKRYVGDVDASGFLRDADFLIAHGLLSSTLRLEMPAYDVDYDAVVPPPQSPERDQVSLNGFPLGMLRGQNNTWIYNSFEVDVRKVKFPADPSTTGGILIPAMNEVRIDIDVANIGVCECWCTAIDWVALRPLNAWRPTLLVHGILSSGSTWMPLWTGGLNDLKIKNRALDVGPVASIQSNSALIAAAVAEMRALYGVDRINIVGHSKGGLDSREYMRSHNDVNRLMMIGTPNAGSPIADFVQGLIVELGGVPSAILAMFATPAGYQLTTYHMNLYNLMVGQNTNSLYGALAGSNDPGGVSSGAPYLLGEDDWVVQVSSVHALSYAANGRYASNDEFSKHTGLVRSSQVYDLLTPFVTEPSTPNNSPIKDRPERPMIILASNQSQHENWTPRSRRTPGGTALGLQTLHSRRNSERLTLNNVSDLQRTENVIGVVQSGATNTHVVAIEASTEIFAQLMWGSGNLDLELVDPLGNIINPVTIVGNPSIQRSSYEEIEGMKIEGYHILNPASGNWTFRVLGSGVLSPTGEAYVANAQITGSDISFAASTDYDFYRKGSTFKLWAALLEGPAPTASVDVTTKILLPDGTTQTIPLFDDGTHGDTTAGDGHFSSLFTNTGQSGLYRILFTGKRDTGVKFSREQAIPVTVSSSLSEFNGTFGDEGIDTDADGLFNKLRIQMGVNVDQAGQYEIKGELEDANGNSIEVAYLDTNLTVGTHMLSLFFDGGRIFQHSVNGPFLLKQLVLSESGSSVAMIVDYLPYAHTTGPYSLNQFQRPPIYLTGSNTDFGTDNNNDGLFDLLTVQIGVNLRQSDFYRWSAKLVDVRGVQIALSSGSGSLAAGASSVSFVFDGTAIGGNGVNGPYFVKDLLLFGSGGANLISSDVTTTQPYQVTQFSGAIQGPTIACPANFVVLSAPGECTRSVTFTVGAGGVPTPTIVSKIGNTVITSPHVFPVGSTTVTCSAENGIGSPAICSFEVTVQDTQRPEISCPGDMIVRPTSLDGVVISYPSPIGTDNCTASTQQTAGLVSGSSFPIGKTVNTFVSTDPSGNTTSCSFMVDVLSPYCADRKVYVCHNNQSICVGVEALPAHLAHGDLLGPCSLGDRGDMTAAIPTRLELSQNYPNPFNPTTSLTYALPADASVKISVFNTLGQEVANLVDEFKAAGYYSVTLDASRLANGVYFYRLETNDQEGKPVLVMRKMLLVK